jgi:RNA ligase (TIGR02306 family)
MSEITRKLVTVQVVDALDPIEGADRIEVASVLGWKIVVQKGLYKVGQMVAFFEIDSFLPILPIFEFLRKSSYRVTKELGEGFRIKTCKLRGQISQGLLMPLEEVGVLYADRDQVGRDITEEMRVRKYEPNQSVLLSGVAAGAFPYYIPKTDEPRVQNLTREKQAWADDFFVVTKKEDGSSMTVFVEVAEDLVAVLPDGIGDISKPGWRVGVCSRNWEVKDEDNNTYWKVAKEIGLVAALNQMGINVAIQGELVGPGVQSNPGKYDKLRFKIFNVWMIAEQRYLSHEERHRFIWAINTLFKTELEQVDSLHGVIKGVTTLTPVLDSLVQQMGKDIEGIVFKSVEHPERSYKYINPNYLLKDKD